MGQINKDSAALPIPPALNIVKPSDERLLGIDVSHWESTCDWQKLYKAGVRFMFAKATESTNFADAALKSHTDAARAAGVLVGAYHFMRSGDGLKQADWFLKTIARMKLDLPCVLDWEVLDAKKSKNQQTFEAMTWLHEVEKATGKPCIVYGGYYFLKDLDLDDAFAKYPLWLAHYGITEAQLKVPKPWKDWTIWQTSESGVLPGVPKGTEVDVNKFKGNMIDLLNLCRK